MIISTIFSLLLLTYNFTDFYHKALNVNQNEVLAQVANKSRGNMNYAKNFTYSSNTSSSSTSSSSTSSSSSSQGSSGQQKTAVSINSANLKVPHILRITTPANTKLTGQVAINGVAIKKIQSSQFSLNLSPYLANGTKTVEISGNYQPKSSEVKIEFSGSGTQVNQQMSGSGRLNQTLVITVR